jgi:hypothetical protein
MKTISSEFLSRPREIMLSRPFLSLHSLPNLPTQRNPRPADLLTSRFADKFGSAGDSSSQFAYDNRNSLRTKIFNSVTFLRVASFVRNASQPALIAVANCKASGVRKL